MYYCGLRPGLLRRSREPAESGRSVEKKMKSSLNAPRNDSEKEVFFFSTLRCAPLVSMTVY
jgi:hypothetical protein